MGAVFEAVQLSLGRRVALKVLALAPVFDKQRLVRFQNEARAAATLDHPHIVSVYAVGQERGVHYYAMRLIDGQSLAEVVAGLRRGAAPAINRQPEPIDSSVEDPPDIAGNETTVAAEHNNDTARLVTCGISKQHSSCIREYFRSVARLGIEAAEALDHAHAQGIVHRDIKPANLLLDDAGRLFVTDFGLARMETELSLSLTATGNLLGTMRYMSPEQASAKRDVTDHRTDIYSLGVTLYEMLVLRPAIDAEDRATILRQLDEHEPPRLRAVDSRIPIDLETIVAKATSKQPADRYASAADLASDLRRYLDHRPILARRASRLTQLRRWAARHRLTFGLIVATLLLLAVFAVGGTWAAWKYRQLAAHERAARTSAETMRKKMQSLLGDTLTTTTETLENTPGIGQLHKDAIQETLDQYEQLLQYAPDDRDLLFDAARARVRLGRVVNLRFGESTAAPLLRQGVEQLEGLRQDWPDDTRVAEELAYGYFYISNLQWNADSFTPAIAAFQQLARRFPEETKYQVGLAYSRLFRGSVLSGMSRMSEAERQMKLAERVARAALEMDSHSADCRGLLSMVLSELAWLHQRTGHLQLAQSEIEECFEHDRAIDKSYVRGTRWRIADAQMLRIKGQVEYCLRNPAQAEEDARQAIAALADVLLGFPDSSWARSELMAAQLLQGDCLVAMQQFDDARAVYEAAIDVGNHPAIILRGVERKALAYHRLGQLLWKQNRRAEAHRALQAAQRFAAETGEFRGLLADLHNTCPDESLHDADQAIESALSSFHPESGLSLRRLGIAHFRAGQWQPAAGALHAGMERLNGGDASDCFYLAMAHRKAGNVQAATHWLLKGQRRMSRPCLTTVDEMEAVRNEAELLLQ
jgi:serine/threonine protein kinase